MKTKLFIFPLLILFATINNPQNKIENIKDIINEIKSKYAPDKRTALFNIEVENKNNKYILTGETNLPNAKAELLSKLDKNITDRIFLLPGDELKEKIYGIVNLSVSNLRTHTGHNEEMATQALLGTVVNVLKKDDGWYLIQTPDDYMAWIDNEGIHRVNKDELSRWQSSDKVIIVKDYCFAYASPDENSERISDLVIGDILTYSGAENGYCKVTYPDGRNGFIKEENCRQYNTWLNELNPTAENIIKTARSFMGIPYLWGGTSVKGMDCSGFTKTVFYLNGIIIPRDASQQYYTGEIIDTKNKIENLLPGDLLFFGSKGSENSKPKITHVAIYIGNGDYIHASGKVRINSFAKDKPNYNAYRDDSFVGAKRILNSINKNGISSILESKYYNKK